MLERLTERDTCGRAVLTEHANRRDNPLTTVIERLAAYEDTGLMPDDIEHVKHTNVIRKELLAKALESIDYLDKELSKRLEREKEMERLDRAMHMDTLDEIEMYRNLLQTCEDRF